MARWKRLNSILPQSSWPSCKSRSPKRGLAAVMGRCAILDPSLPTLEVAAITDAQLSALDAAGHLLAEARREHALSVARGRLNLRAAAAHRPLRIVAGLDTGEA
ncbi:MAG: hypothetical protein JO118_16045 [Acetobacteraceae bacterium]|nr:hypothetical protein [Acetobacteraceae bacterium]